MAVRADDGAVVWSVPLRRLSQPAAGATVVVVDGGTVEGIEVRDGVTRWAVGGADQHGSVAVDDGTVLVGSTVAPDPAPIAGYDLATGARRFRLSLPADYGSITPTADGFVLAQADPIDRGGLALVDARSGRIRGGRLRRARRGSRS